MKAAFINQYGPVQNITIGQVQSPEIKVDQVLIDVVAAGVNPVDFHIRNGLLQHTDTHQLPLIMGWDVAGVVRELGSEVQHLKIGDKVFTHNPINQQGGYAEQLAVNSNLVALKPTSLSFIESAAVPLAALTAWQGIFDDGKLKSGQRILIHNASGGVGSFAVQLAKQAGAYVIATASAAKEEFVMALGADEFIDYKQQAFETMVEPVDLVFAATGGNDILKRSLSIIKSKGHLISTFDDLDTELNEAHSVNFKRMMVQPNREQLDKICTLIDKGTLQVILDSVYPLEEAASAQNRSEQQVAVGKIVLNVNPSLWK